MNIENGIAYRRAFFPGNRTQLRNLDPEKARQIAGALSWEITTRGNDYSPEHLSRVQGRIEQLLRHAGREEVKQNGGPTIALVSLPSFQMLPEIVEVQLAMWEKLAKMLSQLPLLDPQIPLGKDRMIGVERIDAFNLWGDRERQPGEYPFLVSPQGEIILPIEPSTRISNQDIASLATILTAPERLAAAGGRITVGEESTIWIISNECPPYDSQPYTLEIVEKTFAFWGANTDQTALVPYQPKPT